MIKWYCSVLYSFCHIHITHKKTVCATIFLRCRDTFCIKNDKSSFNTQYKSNVKNLEIYCQRLKKLLLQHCQCAYKHSQTFYDPMNLQKQLLHIVQHSQDICFITDQEKSNKNTHNRPSITSFFISRSYFRHKKLFPQEIKNSFSFKIYFHHGLKKWE